MDVGVSLIHWPDNIFIYFVDFLLLLGNVDYNGVKGLGIGELLFPDVFIFCINLTFGQIYVSLIKNHPYPCWCRLW